MVAYTFSDYGYNFHLIDTPGFDDSRFNDDVIVDKILDWLHGATKRNMHLSGIIYMHRITDNRIQGSARSSMAMFRQLCGPEFFRNIVFATTFWDRVDISRGAERERELCENEDFWGLLAKQGSPICRVGYSVKEDQKLLLRIAKNKTALLEAQKQMKAGVDPRRTSAAEAVNHNQQDWARVFARRVEEQQAANQRILDDHDRRRRRQHDAHRAAMEEDARNRAGEDIKKLDEQRQAWEARQAARKTEQARQNREDEARLKDLQQQKEEAVRRQQYWSNNPLPVKGPCRRKPVAEVRCDRCARHVITKRRQFYHCCLCMSEGKKDNYDQCMSCGSRCRDPRHGPMALRSS